VEGVGIAIFWAGYALTTYGIGLLVNSCNAPFLSYINPAASFSCNPDAASPSSGLPPRAPQPTGSAPKCKPGTTARWLVFQPIPDSSIGATGKWVCV
jgi:hypothetical protein